MVVKEFMGNVGRLIAHKEAGMVLNDIYRDICTPAQKLEMLHELYGPEFRLFKVNVGCKWVDSRARKECRWIKY